MSFKFGYLGGKVEESYNRLLSISDLKDLDKEQEYLILCNLPHSYTNKAELCTLEYRTDFEVYDNENDTHTDIATWVVVPMDDSDFEINDLESEFLLLDKDKWEY